MAEFLFILAIVIGVICLYFWGRRSNRIILEPGNETKDPVQFNMLINARVLVLFEKVGYDGLLWEQKVVYSINQLWAMESLVGFRVFYRDEVEVKYVLDVPGAFEAIGAMNMADIVARANAILGEDYLSCDASARQDRINELGEECKKVFSALDEEFYNSEDFFLDLLAEYIAQHRNQFDLS